MGCMFLEVDELDSSGISDHGICLLKAWKETYTHADIVVVHAWDLDQITSSKHTTRCPLNQVDVLIFNACD